jgi:hypothetical protein
MGIKKVTDTKRNKFGKFFVTLECIAADYTMTATDKAPYRTPPWQSQPTIQLQEIFHEQATTDHPRNGFRIRR